jgi:alpha-L-fucosidase
LYAIALAWPENGKLVITSLGTGSTFRTAPVRSVQLLGSKAKLKWQQSSAALVVDLPAQMPGDYAFVFKIN